MQDIHHIRKTMLWGAPLYLAITAGCLFVVVHELIPTLKAIASRAPAVRIAPAAQLAPFIATFCLIGVLLGMMRSVPASERLIQKFERAFNIAVWIGMIALLLIPVTSVTQRFYMPSVGYSMCSELQGNPTMWFTDWVRDPTWCVRGKSLEWVNEQARNAEKN
ncbi:hypothetical protein [Paracidovorax valerianellae]|uniref:Uncharacterized protein n=1 Tax=Paracidovorax valerianellae TaxID=187868 RepID=A0A1G6PAI3_9BURK|nr:hypothetical protein [Paracidovorax valerianellae]MDA8444828.1 hypothetical protein [Paracidovorax valerianellae]SDC77242.1 hypothetical protein SAMN05192589_103190 [Paracidovorax valerianellae]